MAAAAEPVLPTRTADLEASAPSAAAASTPSLVQRVRAFVLKQWFLIGIVLAVILAAIAPSVGRKGGPLAPQITVKYVLVPIVFLVSGYGLPTSKVVESFRFYRVHLLVQSFSFIVIPVTVLLLRLLLLQTRFSPLLADGLLVMACVPTTVSSNVVLTRSAHGNEAASLFNAVFGNVAGIFITPALLVLLLNVSADAPILQVFVGLLATVLAPFLLGQLLRYLVHWRFPGARGWKPPKINNVILIIIIWTAFSTTFSNDINIPAGDVVLVFLFVAMLFTGFSLTLWHLSSIPRLGFAPPERVSVLFSGSHKTVALGVALINLVYGDQAGLLSLPLLLYHPLQLFVGGALVPRLAAFVDQWQQEQTDESDVLQDDAAALPGAASGDIASTKPENGSTAAVVVAAAAVDATPAEPVTQHDPATPVLVGDSGAASPGADSAVDPTAVSLSVTEADDDAGNGEDDVIGTSQPAVDDDIVAATGAAVAASAAAVASPAATTANGVAEDIDTVKPVDDAVGDGGGGGGDDDDGDATRDHDSDGAIGNA